MSGRGMSGWNAAEAKIMGGGMNSMGGMGIDTAVITGNTIKLMGQGTDEKGRKTSSTIVIEKTDKNTLTWQAVERTGGEVEGPSPVYTFQRVKRSQAKK